MNFIFVNVDSLQNTKNAERKYVLKADTKNNTY